MYNELLLLEIVNKNTFIFIRNASQGIQRCKQRILCGRYDHEQTNSRYHYSLLDIPSSCAWEWKRKSFHTLDMIAQVLRTLVLVLGIRNLNEIWLILVEVFVKCTLFLLREERWEGTARAANVCTIFSLQKGIDNWMWDYDWVENNTSKTSGQWNLPW
jgi:hypothetical protein